MSTKVRYDHKSDDGVLCPLNRKRKKFCLFKVGGMREICIKCLQNNGTTEHCLVDSKTGAVLRETKCEVENGKLVPIETGMKVGRNDKCPCMSGKKYKYCCGS